MSRIKQVFAAPGSEEEPLPIERSPWHIGRLAILPQEHWGKIIDFVSKNDLEFGELLEQASFLDGDFSKWSDEKTQRLLSGLEQLCLLINEAEPLVPEASDEFPEDYSNSEHIRMIQAVIAVVEESIRSQEMFDSYVD